MLSILHGDNPQNLFAAFGVKVPEQVLDFSTNTNILAWPEVHVDLERLASHYPDPQCSRLRKLIAEREHIPPSRILFTNGSNEAIFLLGQVLTGNTGIMRPAYSEYSRGFADLQGTFTLTDAGAFANFIVINPNNPTGKFIPDLSRTVRENPSTMFIVDEAYRDFLLYTEPERLCDFHNVILIRSLTKIFHLSGARIGYVIAPEDVIAAMRERQPSWSVNAIAQELAEFFLRDEGFIVRTREFYRENTPAFIERLRQAGCEVLESDVHFFLVRVRDDEKVITHFLRRGIAVRHTRNFAGLDGKYIRIATRRPSENKKLIAAKEVLG